MASSIFNKKTAIITGGASGIGRALCRRLAANGCNIVVADLNEEQAQQTAKELAERVKTLAIKVDVSDQDQVDQLVTTVKNNFGSLDFMFNNAGIEISGEVKDLSLEHWEKSIDVNLKGVIFGTHYAYQTMIEQRSGHIVNIASGAGLVMFPTSIPYTTAKAGVVGLTRALHAEAEAYGVQVTLVCPGMVNTAIYDSAVSIGPDIKEFAKQLPGRMVSADKAAEIILAGISKKNAEIIFPVENVLGAWLVNFSPKLGRVLRRDIVRKFRK